MMSNRRQLAVLSLLSLVFMTAAVAFASEEAAPAAQPQAAAEASAAADEVTQPEATDEPEAEAEVDDGDRATRPQLVLPTAPPPSLRTLVDERRDQLRGRREARFDAVGARYAYMSPWMVTYDRTMDLYQDSMRQLYRRQRDI